MSNPYKLQLRRGTNAQRTSIVFAAGEPFWCTDTNVLYVGDGSTVGGLSVNGGSSTDGITKIRGSYSIPSGVSTFSVAYSAGGSPAQVIVSIRRSSGSLDLYHVAVYNVSSSGFTCDLNGITDTNGYVCDYLLMF